MTETEKTKETAYLEDTEPQEPPALRVAMWIDRIVENSCGATKS